MPAKKIDGCKRKDGYILVTEGGKRKYLHRHVMEIHLGRPLAGEENVHHINHDRADNRIENLKLYSTKAEHTREEGHKPKSKYDPNEYKNCIGCGDIFYRKDKKRKFNTAKFCSHPCSLKHIKRNYHGYILAA